MQPAFLLPLYNPFATTILLHAQITKWYEYLWKLKNQHEYFTVEETPKGGSRSRDETHVTNDRLQKNSLTPQYR